MILPTNEWEGGVDGTNLLGFFTNHVPSSRAGHSMVIGLLEVLDNFLPDTTSFLRATVYTLTSPTAIPTPRVGMALTQVGEVAAPTQFKAWQHTYTFRTDTNTIFKLVLLDADTSTDQDKLIAPVPANVQDVIDELVDPNNAWRGRSGGRPNLFLQVSYTMNERLRKSYRMN